MNKSSKFIPSATKPHALVVNGMNFELLFTTEVIPPSLELATAAANVD